MVPTHRFPADGPLRGTIEALGRWLGRSESTTAAASTGQPTEPFQVTLSDDQWRTKLNKAQYSVLRKQGTESPYTSQENNEHRQGVFACAGCDRELFSSETKFDSGTGWPSFWKPLDGAVATRRDGSLMMARVEVHCSRCGGHLGHVFNDGPAPTGKRYCMNGIAMTFAPVAG